ncbi:uncharacterized protein TRIADDRAFT_57319 [Trichoplax adhaerens]|uniref:Tetraspanin n=1 Tax=Trichoplax adhaerens TaxID=10228 RepID=B3RZ42_TRIAD|nr:hypothetical protein TRIADDRAFT_57319 [Trichoplax adhaerens]EDV23777.1 hypothetical protein TRIADDRAFT_57319 [Trichoplax adhaerens]|eukprot:XP_002113303.1 hypothetical protein TRIADDRAFT_57319 [Trichoplax adhaerens]
MPSIETTNKRRQRHKKKWYKFEPTEISAWIRVPFFIVCLLTWLIGCISLGIGIWAEVQSANLRPTTANGKVNSQIANWTSGPAIILIVMGLMGFIMGFLGCVGALRENLCMLYTFLVSATIILILQIVAPILAYVLSQEATNLANTAVRSSITDYRANADLERLINYIQTSLKCCGGANYNDWEFNIYFNCTSPGPESCGVPYSCCINYTISQLQARTRIYTNGCTDSVKALIRNNLYWFIGIGFGLCLIQLAVLVLCGKLIQEIKAVKTDYEQYYNDVGTWPGGNTGENAGV